MKNKFYSLLCFLCCIQLGYAQPGQRDATFGKRGLAKLTAGIQLEFYNLAFQTDGKVIAVGYLNDGSGVNFIVVRYTAEGSLDTSFSQDGIQTTDFGTSLNYAYSAAVQNDGKIVVAGTSGYNTSTPTTFAIARYNTNGNLDSSFSDDGKQTIHFGYFGSSASSVAIQGDGKILVQGVDNYPNNPYLTLTRLNSNGSLDASFANGGKLTGAPTKGENGAVAIQNNGKIIVGGSSNLYRFNSDGSPDNTFGINGKVFSESYIRDFTLTNEQKIVTAGQVGSSDSSALALARYNTDGSPDNTFNGSGKQTTSFPDFPSGATTVTTQSDGKIVAGVFLRAQIGGLYGSVIIRYNYNGSLDSTFVNGAGIVSVDNYTSKVSVYNNKLYAAGTLDYNSGFVAKYFVDSNKAPVVSITNPVNNQIIAGPATIHLRAAANDPDGVISKVDFYNGSVLLRTETDSPYTYTWKDVPVGNYTITAVATDKSGLSTTSAAVNISVVPNKAPTVSITSPANGETFTAGATIPLLAAAADADGTISTVQFYNGTLLLGTQYISPYTYNWINVSAGTYNITAKATDNLGLSAISAPVTITVSDTTIVSNRVYLKTDKSASNDALHLRLSPNPATDILNIYTKESEQNKPATLSIISLSGIVLKTMRISNSSTHLDISSLASGVYMIKIISRSTVLLKQFVKL